MSVCALAGVVLVACVQSTDFTLTWTHSVERVEWQEDWRVDGDTLIQTQARVKGSGAGMDPAPGAQLLNGWYVWVPQPALHLQEIRLANSGATVSAWTLCDLPDRAHCVSLGTALGDPPQEPELSAQRSEGFVLRVVSEPELPAEKPGGALPKP
ncbi:DUF1850 domain-containing protein [Limnobacter humi]|uniref:DUF1850 domain-containing protein n=1 Tax=Limnobacter humi TaxID=1778671 RepID=A0ABT1WGP1_9BURK|nr:DUF1850 domain-containing protein [Limnobacter humi]MCQ8896645.1 DUF1850 domain-containing protein [Limnobacter humi]